jgi:hypothetical protein
LQHAGHAFELLETGIRVMHAVLAVTGHFGLLHLGELAAEHGGDGVELFGHVDRAGPGEDGADRRAATISALRLGTWASTLRRKCTRQRCQAAPMNTELMAACSPAWASEMTS